jgi:predicted ribosome quality control (RQC) complex YloA/Tae2 family protein
MSLRASELDLLARELERELAGAVVQKVYAPTPARVFLELRVPGKSALLLFSAEPKVARVSAVEHRPPNPERPPAWQAVLRRELVGARLLDAESVAGKKTLLVHLGRAGKTFTLALETGGEPMLLLLTREARVLALSSPARDGLRPGATWTPLPDTQEPPSPSRLASDFVFLRLLHAAETLFGAVEEATQRSAARAPLAAKLKKLAKTREKVAQDAARAAKAPQLRAEGELLKQNLHRLKRGERSVTVTEYLEDGTTTEHAIALDPKRTPLEEVEHRFHQSKRLLRGQALAAQRLLQLDREKAELEAQLAAVEAGQAPRALDTTQGDRRDRGAKPTAPKPYREYTGHGGQRLWVGKGSAQNDTLTFHVAKPHHAWVHARGVPGAHVVVPLEKGQALAQETLLDAAHLAVHHSDAKGEPRAEVAQTLVKFVRKPKDAAPGAVTYTREKVLLLRVEPDRLARLLASAQE